MKKYTLQTEFSAYDSPESLPEADRELLLLAKKSLENAYSPYSNFKVGAAVLLENDEMLGGTNYENASYPLCICAEQTVLTTAANRFPNVPALAIAVTVKNPKLVIDRPGPPCGACRQVICETEMKNGKPMRVILQGETGPVYVFESGKDLLPLAFDQSFLH
jgi:cytidine deaminase